MNLQFSNLLTATSSTRFSAVFRNPLKTQPKLPRPMHFSNNKSFLSINIRSLLLKSQNSRLIFVFMS